MPIGGRAQYSSPVNRTDLQGGISFFGANNQTVSEPGEETITLAQTKGSAGHATATERRP
jgi:histidinol dehydrogenase